MFRLFNRSIRWLSLFFLALQLLQSFIYQSVPRKYLKVYRICHSSDLSTDLENDLHIGSNNKQELAITSEQIEYEILLKQISESNSSMINTTISEITEVFSFRFDTKHKHKIIFPEAISAHSYLSLPASAYSILNSSLVSRSSSSDDTFILSFPLRDFGSALQVAMPNSPRIDADLEAEVLVKPMPDNCLVLMESGIISFKPSSTAAATTATTNNTTNTPASTEDWLPEWLVWANTENDQGKLLYAVYIWQHFYFFL